MFETGDVWGLGGVGDWVGVSDGGGRGGATKAVSSLRLLFIKKSP